MPDRLSPLDVSFLYIEDTTTAMHVGGVATFRVPKGGFDHERLVELIRERIALVPRYRQRVRWVPGQLSTPVWVDDEAFDLAYHVRRSALPRPGTDEQLREFVARVQGRRLDRSRPLWEVYLVEGLGANRFAIVTKTHHAMVDGVSAVDIGQIILDPSPRPLRTPAPTWTPHPEPGPVGLVADALLHAVRRPSAVAGTARAGLADLRSTATRARDTAGGLLAMARAAARPAPDSPLNAQTGEARRFATASTKLADYTAIRTAHGGTVNDVALAAVAGALRSWLLSRGEMVTATTTVRAMVPVSVRSAADDGALGNRISSYFVDLPVGEGDPVMRLHQVSHAMRAHKEGGQSIGAQALIGVAGCTPPTVHALGARAASALSRRLFNLVVSNVPGPQVPLYAMGAKMLEAYPVVPLVRGQAVTVGLTSYNGGVYYGLNGDHDAMPDVDILAESIAESVAELRETVR